jgi:plastocyanin
VRVRVKGGPGVLVLAGAMLLAACGSGSGTRSGTSSTTGASSNGTSITISNFMFQPMSLTVAPGGTVSVTNKDSATHTLTATGGQFDTGNIDQDHTKTFTAPMKPGTYHYICNIHQYMMGSIIVK